MAVKTFTTGEVLTASDTNTYLNNGGLVYVKSQVVGSGVTTVTVSDAFSATYDNYRIIYSGGTSSSASSLGMRLGTSAANYYGFLVSGVFSTNTVNGTGRNNTDRMFYLGGSSGAGQAVVLSVDVINPFTSLYTRFLNGIYLDTNEFGTMQGEHRVVSSYSSFEILPGAGTITGGTITVYGYRKA